MDKKTTTDVVNMLGCHRNTANNWAQKNGIEAICDPNGKVFTYLWSEEDIARFLARPKPGKRTKKKPLAIIESEKKDGES